MPSLSLATNSTAVRVLIVDDQAHMRNSLMQLIGSTPGDPFSIVTASTRAEALLAIEVARPHLVVLDVDLNGDDGLLLLPVLVPRSRVLVLTSQIDRFTRERALRLGASAVMGKHEPGAMLVAALRNLVIP